MQKLKHMQLFLEVAAAGSISRIAKQRGISVAAISKKISALEADLQVSLFHRSHRRMNLTAIGENYLKQCQKVMESIAQAEQIIAAAKTEPAGHLHITSGRYFAERFILPNLEAFLQHYPKLTIEIEIADHPPDLKEGKTDLVFGMSMQHAAPDLICRKVATTQYALCASPQYLQKHGTPQTPMDLRQHHYITNQHRKPDNTLEFGHQRVILQPTLKLNDAHAMLTAALHHLGIVNLNRYIVESMLKEGQLIEVLAEYALPPKPMYLFYRQSDYLEPKIRCFIDFFLGKMQS